MTPQFSRHLDRPLRQFSLCCVPHPTQILQMSLLATLGISGLNTLPAIAQPSQPQPYQIAQATPAADYNLVFVNPQVGNDGSNGSDQAPLRTITKALQLAQPNTIIVLSPGTYSTATGEVFPLNLKPGVTLQGEPRDRGQNIVIRGSGVFLSKSFGRQNVAIVGANRAGLRGVTVSNPTPQGYGVWIESSSPVLSDNTFTGSDHDGVSIVGNSAPVLKNNYFYENGANGVTIYGTSRPELRENIFEKTGFGVNIAQNAAPRLIGNRITQNQDGVVVQGNARPILRGNVIDGNVRDGLVAIANTQPDLGTVGDLGNNTFLSNGQSDVNAKTSSQIIPAAGNQFSTSSGRLDLNATTVAAAPVESREPLRLSTALPVRTTASTRPAANLPAPTASTAIPIPVPVATATMPTAIPATSEQPVREITFSRPTSGNPLRPAASPTPIAARPAPRPDVVVPTNASSGIPNSMPNSVIVPVAVAPVSSGGRSLPLPKQAKSSSVTTGTSSPSSLAANPSLNSPLNSPAPLTFNAWTSTPAARPSNVLPVPGSSIPLGNVGDMASVPVWRGGKRSSVGSPPIPPTRSGAPAAVLRVRVVAPLSDERALRTIVPDAFTTTSRGQTVLQAGAFSDRAKADQLLQSLTSLGIQATLEEF
ncbi:DUF1565 domain-containing protein [Alkalinema sp. FACHB-956]|uniref:DUF1565 domain-containing protein n=1 Tax=Alkalinema sp. FACHB-956 TaxID=2692768 RepID=UPI001685A307|nr:DUF1565 domain-containing protein [Alkalinema sp. FACHB-956]